MRDLLKEDEEEYLSEDSSIVEEELKFDNENQSNRLIIGKSINEELLLPDNVLGRLHRND